MTDLELILYLCKILWDLCSDGDMPDDKDFETLNKELKARGQDPDDIFGY